MFRTMAVPKSRRTEQPDVCYLAGLIEFKVIKMTMNEKYFPKKARYIIANKLIDLASNITINFDAANDIFPSKEQKLELRETYQVIGKANISPLEHQLNLARQLFNIPNAILEDIFSDIAELKNMYPNWVKSGRKILQRKLNK